MMPEKGVMSVTQKNARYNVNYMKKGNMKSYANMPLHQHREDRPRHTQGNERRPPLRARRLIIDRKNIVDYHKMDMKIRIAQNVETIYATPSQDETTDPLHGYIVAVADKLRVATRTTLCTTEIPSTHS